LLLKANHEITSVVELALKVLWGVMRAVDAKDVHEKAAGCPMVYRDLRAGESGWRR
jgi:hypothetical protein